MSVDAAEKLRLPLSSGARFRYSVPSWQALRATIEHLPKFGRAIPELGRRRFGEQATVTEVMRHWLECAAADYSLAPDARGSSLRTRELLCEKILRQIGELGDTVVDFTQAAFGGQALPDDVRGELEQAIDALSDMRGWFADVRGCLAPDSVAHFGCGFAPFGQARTVYFRQVLDVWLRLGGELKISRHPVSGEVRGPLTRYFFAAIGPVMGAEVPAATSLPAIVSAYRSLELNGYSTCSG